MHPNLKGQMTLSEGRNVDTLRCTQGECHARIKAEAKRDASVSQGTPKIASKPPEARRGAKSRFSLTATEGTNPTDALTSDFPPPEP